MQNYFKMKHGTEQATSQPRLARSSVASGKHSFRVGQYKKHPADRPINKQAPTRRDHISQGETQANVLTQSLEQLAKDPIVTRTKTLGTNEKNALLQLAFSPQLFFGPPGMDVFGVLPVTLTPWDERLMNRFSHIRKWPWCPVSGQSLWGPFALSNKVLFSTTMYSWCMAFRSRLKDLEVNSWLENNPEILQHKANAIALMNTTLSNTTKAIQDETLAAVAAMTNVELVFGSRETAEIHIEGLRQLVGLRGGFATFVTPLQLLVQRLISWSDLMYSGIAQTPLYFPAVELWDLAWQTLDQFSVPGSPLCLAPTQVKLHGIPQYDIVEVMELTRRLCFLEQQHPLLDLDEAGRMRRADMCMGLETRLSRIIHATNPSHGSPEATTVEGWAGEGNSVEGPQPEWTLTAWRATALATLIYIHHVLRGSRLRSRQFGNWVGLLYDTLSHSPPTLPSFSFSRALVLWVLAIGAAASQHHQADGTHTWFVAQLKDACRGYGLAEFDQFCMAFRDFIWSGGADENMYWALWPAIAAFVHGA